MTSKRLPADLLTALFDTPNQAWMTRNFSQPVGRVLAWLGFNLGLTPNALTVIGLLLSLSGCLVYLASDSLSWSLCAAAIIWQVAFAFDCADGQLARATRGGSNFGAWLDLACDHVRQAALSFTVLYALIDRELPNELVFILCASFMAAQTNFLHVVTVIGQIRPPAHGLREGRVDYLRRALVNFTDTPVLMLLLVVLKPWTFPLLILIVLYTAATAFRAVMLAWLRIRMPEPFK